MCRETSPLARLQRTVGNRAINRLLRSRTIQPKLTVSHPDDPYEREADRVSDEVMRMPGPTSLAVQRGPARIQRFCPECEKEQPARNATRAPMQISRMCTECEEKTHFRGTEREGPIQRKSDPAEEKDEEDEGLVQAKRERADPPEPSSGLASYVAASRGGGQPLLQSTREHFEGRFGHDFRGVRVHTDSRSADAAAEVNSYAFTTGSDIHFGAGRFKPGTPQGDRLLAHELTHVIQQDASRTVRLQRAACTVGVLTDTRCEDAQGAGHPSGTNLEHFAEEKHQLKPAHLSKITVFKTAWVAAGSKDDVKVHGYASCDGSANLNVQLSCDRAEAVKDELIARGITTTITTVAHGETDEFGASLDANRRAIIESVGPPPAPPPPPALCKGVPSATPATCIDRNAGYCSAASCFPANPWLQCVCKTSLQICQAVDAFSLTSVQGMQLEACIDTTVQTPTNLGVKFESATKGKWFLDTNKCIWGHWREALDPLHDPSLPVPSTVTAPWKTAIGVCRSKGVGSAECCKAQVDAEQQAIDTCGPYKSSRFGPLPTDIPGAAFCSFAAKQVAPKPGFSGDFGNVTDRIAHGLKLCCP